MQRGSLKQTELTPLLADVANRSSTYRYLNSDFRITYADQSGASGDYVVDTITIAGNSLPGLQFGIGYRSTSGGMVLEKSVSYG
jgi:hypothetical protein